MKKTKIILILLISTLLFTGCSQYSKIDIVESETVVSSGGTLDDNSGQNIEMDYIDESDETSEIDYTDGNANNGNPNVTLDNQTNDREIENDININDIFNDTYWVTKTGAIEGEMAMSIHKEAIYGFSVGMGDLSGGRIENLEIKGNTAYISTYFTDGNGNATIEYVITQTKPGAITVTEKWLKEPIYEYTETYYQISEDEFYSL